MDTKKKKKNKKKKNKGLSDLMDDENEAKDYKQVEETKLEDELLPDAKPDIIGPELPPASENIGPDLSPTDPVAEEPKLPSILMAENEHSQKKRNVKFDESKNVIKEFTKNEKVISKGQNKIFEEEP